MNLLLCFDFAILSFALLSSLLFVSSLYSLLPSLFLTFLLPFFSSSLSSSFFLFLTLPPSFQRWVSGGCEYLCLDDPLCLYELCTIPVGCMWAGFPSSFCARDPFWSLYDPTEADCIAEEALCNDLSVICCYQISS